jgi:hypothetical protein
MSGRFWKGHSKYRSSKNPDGKVEIPMTDAEFDEGIKTGHFVSARHKAYAVLLWYSAIREGEGLKAIREQFNRNPEGDIVFEVGERFKKTRYRKTCPKCLDKWNSSRASFCKCCGANIKDVQAEKVKTKTVKTPPLTLPMSAPHMLILQNAIEETPRGERLFQFSPGTAYNIIHRVWNYPHLMRLSRISWFLSHDWTPIQIKSWTGLSLAAIDYYVGLVEVAKMGKSMGATVTTMYS